MRCTEYGRTTFLLAMLAALAVPIAAQNPAVVRLTNSDIVKMVNAGIPESVIVREIQVSETNFNISPDALISLKHKHVPDSVLGAIVDSQAAAIMQPAEPAAGQYGSSPGYPAHFHRLPNVDAAFRIDSKTSGKVEVRANQIKVEKAGVPLFSVKWKDNTAK